MIWKIVTLDFLKDLDQRLWKDVAPLERAFSWNNKVKGSNQKGDFGYKEKALPRQYSSLGGC